MNTTKKSTGNFRWTICSLLFFATTINYLDRQVLSLTWSDFIAPEFHWTNNDYGNITALFSIFYAYYFQLNLLIFLVSISKNLNIK
jgi:ACS family hexuronate transporter-like MFS transporter